MLLPGTAGEGSALPWCAALSSSPLLLATRCSTGEQRQLLGDDSFGSRERWPLLLLFCGYPCRQGRHSLAKTEVLREYTALRHESRDSPSAPQSHSRCLWGIKQEKEWTRLCEKLEDDRWATAMGRDYVTVPFSGKYLVWIWFFIPDNRFLRSHRREKNVYGTQRICSCSKKTATQFLSPHIDFMTISAVSIY